MKNIRFAHHGWATLQTTVTLLLLSTLASCAGGPLDREDAQRVAAEPSIPKSIFLEVRCEDTEGDTFGTAADWTRDLTEHFWYDLQLCEMVWHAGDEHVSPEDADLVLRVEIKPEPPERREAPRVDGKGAFLDFLAWSTIPLLPLWIEDVHVDPGIEVQLTLDHDPADQSDPDPMADSAQVGRIATCMLDRYPVVSWPTVGAILLPPFAYQRGDPERLGQTVAKEVHLEAAIQIANLLKNPDRRDDLRAKLLQDFEVSEDGRSVNFIAHENVGELVFEPDRDQLEETRVLDGTERNSLEPVVSPTLAPGTLLRITAHDRRSRERETYTILLVPNEQI